MQASMSMKKGQLRSIASFMIFLVLTIPFYVSNVMAVDRDTVNIVKRSGEDGVDGFRKKFDTTAIEVEVLPDPARNVRPAQVQAVLNNPGNAPAPFASCTLKSGTLYSCAYQGATNTLDYGTYNWLVCGVDCLPCNPGLPVSSCRKATSITVDEQPPAVTSMSVSPTAANGGDATLTFSLADAIGEGSPVCSGLGDVTIMYGGVLVASTSLDTADCTRAGITQTFSAASFPNGNDALCLFVTDRVGNALTTAGEANCIQFAKDDTPPEVVGIQILDPVAHVPLTFVGAGSPALSVGAIVFSSPYFGEPDVTATVSKAGTEVATPSFTCESAGEPGAWNCTAASFNVAMDAAAALDITVTATDEGGNVASASSSVMLQVDTDRGQVVEVGTGVLRTVGDQRTGFLRARGANTIYALIAESGAGFSGNRVSFNTDAGMFTAQCRPFEPGSSWRCENTAVSIPAGRPSVTGTVQGYDGAGQAIVSQSFTFYIDGEAPELDRVVLRNEGGENDGQPFFLSGDTVRIMAYFNEKPLPEVRQVGMQGETSLVAEPVINVSIDLSKVTGDTSNPKPEACGLVSEVHPPAPGESPDPALEGKWVCSWHIIAPPKMLEFRFFPADALGNKPSPPATEWIKDVRIEYVDRVSMQTRETEPQQVTPGISDDAVRNCWLLEEPLQANPPVVDAEVAGKYGFNVWYPLNLRRESCVSSRDEDVGLASINLDPSTCTGDTDMIQSAAIVTPDPSSPAAFLKLVVGPAQFTKERLKLDCALTLISDLPPREGQRERRVSLPETENFTATVQLTRTQAIDDALVDEIKDVKDSVDSGFFSVLDVLNRVVTFLNQLCNILYLLNTINQILAVFRVAVIPCQAIPFCKAVVPPADIAAGRSDDIARTTWGKVEYACRYLSCRTGFWYSDALDDAYGGIVNDVNGALSSATTFKGPRGEELRVLGQAPVGGTPPNFREDALLGSVGIWGSAKNSLVMSTITMCVPGIIFNVMKARQVECQYLQCLASEVPSGADPATCTSMRAFGWCMFVYGEVFQLIPFAQFIKGVLNAFVGAFKDVWGIVGVAMGFSCWLFGTPDTDNWVDQACQIAKLPKQLEEVYENVKGFGEASSWGLGQNSCNAAIDKANEVIKAHEEAEAQEEEAFMPPPPPAPGAPIGE